MLTIKDLVFYDGVRAYLEDRRGMVERYPEVFLFGSARGGERVYEYLSEFGLEKKIRYVIDNDKMKQGKKFHNIDIISAEKMVEIFALYESAVVIIASGSAHIIRNQLRNMGIPDDVMEPFVITNLQLNPTPCQFFERNKKQIQKVYELLEDERSKEIFVSLLNFKMTQDRRWLEGIANNESDQYFDEVLKINSHEAFVDCGAYIGDTLDEYNQRFQGKWDSYYCFEADPDVYRELEKHIEERGYIGVECYNVGCWDKQEFLHFDKQGSGSSTIVDKQNGITIEANTIDTVLRDKTVTVLKMDIEGAEQKALTGSAQIIREQHPKLAISIYHSLEDFIFIPEILKEYSKEYKIYIRHYRELTDSETICYAV